MEDAILRIIHIVCGVVWAGNAMFMGFYLIPAVQEAGPAGGAVMGGLAQRRLPMLMNVVSILAVLSGLRLYQLRFSAEWLATANGIVVTAGLLAGVVALLMGFLVSKPTVARLGVLGQEIRAAGGSPRTEQAAEMRSLNSRLLKAARTGATLLALTVLAMAGVRFAALL